MTMENGEKFKKINEKNKTIKYYKRINYLKQNHWLLLNNMKKTGLCLKFYMSLKSSLFIVKY